MNLSINARLIVSAVVAVFLTVVGASVFGNDTQAQSVNSRKLAEDALRSGLAAQKARRHDVAVNHLSRAIGTGSLARKQMTYALYRRAISNRALKQSGHAISDLNSALFFKGDLSMRDRADALEERMKAFRDAGVKPPSVAIAGTAAQWKPTASSAPVARAVPRPRIVSTAPPRVIEPVRVVKPRQRTSTPTVTGSILPPATSTVKKTPGVATRKVSSAFRTRVTAAPLIAPAPVKPVALPRSSSVVSFATPKVERGVGVPRAVRRTVRLAKPSRPWNVATRPKPVMVAAPAPVARVIAKPVVRSTAITRQPVRVTPTSKPRPESRPAVVARAKPETVAPASGNVGEFFLGLFSGPSAGAVNKTNSPGSAWVKRPETAQKSNQ